VYNWDLRIFNDERGEYVLNNYHLEQAGFYNNQPTYFLFKKGGNTSMEEMEKQINSGIVNTKMYEKTTGQEEFVYVNVI